mmetsp:Transcript_48107/g.114352  ORF Transcript_48107/g.114352 Transcript_48107/m.114352 type:complete len:426 (+) Transcript_48107:76-1353(+)
MAGLSTRGGAAASSVFVLACLVAFAAFASYGQAGKSLLLQLGSLPSLSVSTSGGRGRTGTTQLPQYDVGGSFELPANTGAAPCEGSNCGGPGKFQVKIGSQTAGDVNVHTEPAPPVPQPMVVRYGDVVAKPAGCPNCPVIDKKVVELQKQKMQANQARIDRLRTLLDKNREQMEGVVGNMKVLKTVMSSSVFEMKEAMHRVDTDIESKMVIFQNETGVEGPKGLSGYSGEEGVDGEPGANGENGVEGLQGSAGGSGFEGHRGHHGPHGPSGPIGKGGKEGPVGRPGPTGVRGYQGSNSLYLACSRIGGQVYRNICFKSKALKRNKDDAPEGCMPWAPKSRWKEDDWWNLVQLFQRVPAVSSHIDRDGRDGGLCDNRMASMSFTQTGQPKVWLNSRTWWFSPVNEGATCNIYNGDDTVAVYACVVS